MHMHIDTSAVSARNSPPPEYEAAMDEADLGELTLGQARQEIFELRERLALDAAVLTQWAMRSHV
jgi:hypothetical protein